MQKKWLTDDRIASDERTPRFERLRSEPETPEYTANADALGP
jgi:hypothetical protein